MFKYGSKRPNHEVMPLSRQTGRGQRCTLLVCFCVSMFSSVEAACFFHRECEACISDEGGHCFWYEPDYQGGSCVAGVIGDVPDTALQHARYTVAVDEATSSYRNTEKVTFTLFGYDDQSRDACYTSDCIKNAQCEIGFYEVRNTLCYPDSIHLDMRVVHCCRQQRNVDGYLWGFNALGSELLGRAFFSSCCTPCYPGHSNVGCSAYNTGECKRCPRGRFNPSGAQGSICQKCQPCPAGQVRKGCGPSSEGRCETCPVGRFKAGVGKFDDECEECPGCPAGGQRTSCGPTNIGRCDRCEDGSWFAPPSCRKCNACQQGYRIACGGASNGVCTLCGAGLTDRGGGLCSPCASCDQDTSKTTGIEGLSYSTPAVRLGCGAGSHGSCVRLAASANVTLCPTDDISSAICTGKSLELRWLANDATPLAHTKANQECTATGKWGLSCTSQDLAIGVWAVDLWRRLPTTPYEEKVRRLYERWPEEIDPQDIQAAGPDGKGRLVTVKLDPRITGAPSGSGYFVRVTYNAHGLKALAAKHRESAESFNSESSETGTLLTVEAPGLDFDIPESSAEPRWQAIIESARKAEREGDKDEALQLLMPACTEPAGILTVWAACERARALEGGLPVFPLIAAPVTVHGLGEVGPVQIASWQAMIPIAAAREALESWNALHHRMVEVLPGNASAWHAVFHKQAGERRLQTDLDPGRPSTQQSTARRLSDSNGNNVTGLQHQNTSATASTDASKAKQSQTPQPQPPTSFVTNLVGHAAEVVTALRNVTDSMSTAATQTQVYWHAETAAAVAETERIFKAVESLDKYLDAVAKAEDFSVVRFAQGATQELYARLKGKVPEDGEEAATWYADSLEEIGAAAVLLLGSWQQGTRHSTAWKLAAGVGSGGDWPPAGKTFGIDASKAANEAKASRPVIWQPFKTVANMWVKAAQNWLVATTTSTTTTSTTTSAASIERQSMPQNVSIAANISASPSSGNDSQVAVTNLNSSARRLAMNGNASINSSVNAVELNPNVTPSNANGSIVAVAKAPKEQNSTTTTTPTTTTTTTTTTKDLPPGPYLVLNGPYRRGRQNTGATLATNTEKISSFGKNETAKDTIERLAKSVGRILRIVEELSEMVLEPLRLRQARLLSGPGLQLTGCDGHSHCLSQAVAHVRQDVFSRMTKVGLPPRRAWYTEEKVQRQNLISIEIADLIKARMVLLEDLLLMASEVRAIQHESTVLEGTLTNARDVDSHLIAVDAAATVKGPSESGAAWRWRSFARALREAMAIGRDSANRLAERRLASLQRFGSWISRGPAPDTVASVPKGTQGIQELTRFQTAADIEIAPTLDAASTIKSGFLRLDFSNETRPALFKEFQSTGTAVFQLKSAGPLVRLRPRVLAFLVSPADVEKPLNVTKCKSEDVSCKESDAKALEYVPHVEVKIEKLSGLDNVEPPGSHKRFATNHLRTSCKPRDLSGQFEFGAVLLIDGLWQISAVDGPTQRKLQVDDGTILRLFFEVDIPSDDPPWLFLKGFPPTSVLTAMPFNHDCSDVDVAEGVPTITTTTTETPTTTTPSNETASMANASNKTKAASGLGYNGSIESSMSGPQAPGEVSNSDAVILDGMSKDDKLKTKALASEQSEHVDEEDASKANQKWLPGVCIGLAVSCMAIFIAVRCRQNCGTYATKARNSPFEESNSKKCVRFFRPASLRQENSVKDLEDGEVSSGLRHRVSPARHPMSADAQVPGPGASGWNGNQAPPGVSAAWFPAEAPMAKQFSDAGRQTPSTNVTPRHPFDAEGSSSSGSSDESSQASKPGEGHGRKKLRPPRRKVSKGFPANKAAEEQDWPEDMPTPCDTPEDSPRDSPTKSSAPQDDVTLEAAPVRSQASRKSASVPTSGMGVGDSPPPPPSFDAPPPPPPPDSPPVPLVRGHQHDAGQSGLSSRSNSSSRSSTSSGLGESPVPALPPLPAAPPTHRDHVTGPVPPPPPIELPPELHIHQVGEGQEPINLD